MRSDPLQTLRMSRPTVNSSTILGRLAQDFHEHGIDRRNDRSDQLKLIGIDQERVLRHRSDSLDRGYSRVAS